MYDIVSKTPYYNRGSGDFLYPEPTSSTVFGLRKQAPEWGKLTPTGVRKLYKLPDNYVGEAEDFISQNGFKQLVEPEMPEEGYWKPHWYETDTQLILEWIETEEPEIIKQPTDN